MQYTNGNPGKESRNVSIGIDRSLGATYKELAEKHDLSTKHISRILNDSEIRDIVETGTRHMVSYLPIALSRFYDVLQDPENSDHYKAIKDNLQAAGILPSHTSNVTINNILAINSGPQQDQVERIQELIQVRHAIDIRGNDEIIDITPVDSGNIDGAG